MFVTSSKMEIDPNLLLFSLFIYEYMVNEQTKQKTKNKNGRKWSDSRIGI